MYLITQYFYTFKRQYTIFFLNFFLLIIMSFFSFTWNSSKLLTGLDGPALASASEEQFTFFGETLNLHSNVLQGLGNVYANNLTLMPSIFHYPGLYNPVPFYICVSLQLFLSVLLVGWNYRFSYRISYAAAWLLTTLFVPYFNDFRIYSVIETAPLFVGLMIVFALMDIGIYRMGSISWLNTFFYGTILFLGIILGLLYAPIALILIIPLLLLTTIHAFLKTTHRIERLRKIIMGLFILLVVIAAGWLQLIYGLLSNTVANIFYAEIPGFYHSLIYVSILFLGNVPQSTWGPYFFYTSTLGILLAIHKSQKLRSLAITILIAQLMIVGGGVILMKQPKPFLGPSPIYFEVLLFPFYALFTTFLFSQIIRITKMDKLFSNGCDFVFPILISGIIFCYMIYNKPSINRGTSYALPPASTIITEILEKEIAVNPHSTFLGRVVNIIPNMNWLEQCSYFLGINTETGNDHQASGLWLKHIPTLHEYNQTITPGFYRIYRRFLSSPSESLYRNWTSFSRVNLKILRLLGVRFIISTLPEIKETKLRAKLKFKNNSLLPLYLHELSDINKAGISASRIIIAKNIHEAEDLMADKYFNLHDAIIISKEKYNNTVFVPALNSRLIIEHGGFRLQAESKGTTLLLLPIEFTHCLNVKVFSGAMPKILRADVALTGILFNYNVDIRLDNRTGPFVNPHCKMRDYKEFTQLWRTEN